MSLCEENSGWVFDVSLLDNLASLEPAEFDWPENAFADPVATSLSSELGESLGASDEKNDCGSRKRARGVACGASESKAFKEKLRRGRLNDRFLELSAILEPGRAPKTDKSAILSNAMHMVIQLREQAQKLQESTENLQKQVKELKAEKNELRDEKQKLKAEMEKLDQQVKALSSHQNFMPHPMSMPAPFPPQAQVVGSKLVPVMSYPGVPMWQFMPHGAVDTSEDHVLRPPVA